MDLRKLQRVVVDALDDIKAQDIKVFNTVGQTDLFDRVVIATATSNRQTRALAAHVRDKVKEAGGHVISVEGEDTGEWVLVDLGDAVVHIMQPAIRSYYNLEELWGAKPVRIQVGPPARPGASPDEEEEPAELPAAPRKTAARKAASAGETGATKAAGARPATAAKKAPAAKKPAAAKRSAAEKEPAAAKKPAAARKPAAGKPASPAGLRSASKAPASRAPAARKAGATKAPRKA